MAESGRDGGFTGGDKEIQLIDIIAIMLKRRRLILGLLAIALIWSIAGAGEDRFSARLETVGEVDSVIILRANPALKFLSDMSLDDLALTFLHDPRFIAGALQVSGHSEFLGESISELDIEGLSRFVMNKLLNIPDPADIVSRSRFVASKETGNIRLSLVGDADLDSGMLYDAIFRSLNARLREWVVPIAQAELDSYNQYASLNYPRQVIEQDLYKMFVSYNSAKSFIERGDPVYLKLNEVVALPNTGGPGASSGSSLIKDLVIKVIAFLVAGVMLSFMLEWIDGVKSNSSSMDKLRAAMQKPGRKARSGS